MVFAFLVCIICSHPAPATALSDFSVCLEEKGIRTKVLSGGVAYETLVKAGRETDRFPEDPPTHTLTDSELEELAWKVAAVASRSKCVIVDVGNPLSAKILRILSTEHPDIIRIAFRDNAQDYVAGGYSELDAKILPLAQIILYANQNLANGTIYSAPGKPIDLKHQRHIGLGYSTLFNEMPRLRELKTTQGAEKRAALLEKLGVVDTGQKIVVYLGGANRVYEEEAFPHFLNLLKETEQNGFTFVLQPHPRGKKPHLEGTNLIYSSADFELALLGADLVLYHQTSANLKCFLLGTPTFQVTNSEEKNDLLVAEEFIKSLVCQKALQAALQAAYHPINPEEEARAYEAFGLSTNWQEPLFQVIRPIVKPIVK